MVKGLATKYSPDSRNRMVVADAANSGALLVVHSPSSVGSDGVPALPGGGGFWSPPEHPRISVLARLMMQDLEGNIGSPEGQRTDAQRLQLSPDRCGPGQAIAGGRRGMGLKPATDRYDRPLQLGWDALG